MSPDDSCFMISVWSLQQLISYRGKMQFTGNVYGWQEDQLISSVVRVVSREQWKVQGTS